jgi:hypothetical protein
MQNLVLEFPTEKEMRETVKKLWESHNVSGEVAVRPAANGRWRVEILAEKEIRESTLEKYAQYRVEGDD